MKPGFPRKVITYLYITLYEVFDFYYSVLKLVVVERRVWTGFLLLLASPYILVLSAVMRWIPREFEDKVLPFVYTMQ